jgi:hypothetical protein
MAAQRNAIADSAYLAGAEKNAKVELVSNVAHRQGDRPQPDRLSQGQI